MHFAFTSPACLSFGHLLCVGRQEIGEGKGWWKDYLVILKLSPDLILNLGFGLKQSLGKMKKVARDIRIESRVFVTASGSMLPSSLVIYYPAKEEASDFLSVWFLFFKVKCIQRLFPKEGNSWRKKPCKQGSAS